MKKPDGSKSFYGTRCPECGSKTDVHKSKGKRGDIHRERRCLNPDCRTRIFTIETVVKTLPPVETAASSSKAG